MARFGRSYIGTFTSKGYQAGAAPLSLPAEAGSYSFSGTAATLTKIKVTFNPSDKHANITLSNSNLTASRVGSGVAWICVRVNRSHNTGKWYFEQTNNGGFNATALLSAASSLATHPGSETGSAFSIGLYDNGDLWFNGSSQGFTSAVSSLNEAVAFAVDFDAGKAWVRDSTGWVGDPAAGTGNSVTFTPNITLYAAAALSTVSGDATVTANFGNSAFAYTVPAGFLAWDEETIRAEAGSYSYSGTDASLEHGWELVPEAASYSFAGQDVTLDRTYRLTAAATSYSFAGSDATLTYTPLGETILSADAGSYAFAGQTASLERGYVLIADAGVSAGGSPMGLLLLLTGGGGSTYSFSGAPVDLTITTPATLDADSGSFSFAGQDVTLDRTFKLIAAAGAYSFAGQDVTLDRTYRLIADSASYSFAGQDVTLDRTFRFISEAGSYSFVGTDAELTYEPAGQTILGAAGGSFEFSGSDVTLTLVRALELAAEAGAFTFTGSDAALTYTPTAPTAPTTTWGGEGAEFWVRKWRKQAQALKPVVVKPFAEVVNEQAPAQHVIPAKDDRRPDPEFVEFTDFIRLLEKL